MSGFWFTFGGGLWSDSFGGNTVMARSRKFSFLAVATRALGFPLGRWRPSPGRGGLLRRSGGVGGDGSWDGRGGYDLAVDWLALGERDGLVVRVAGGIESADGSSRHRGAGDVEGFGLGRQRDSILLSLGQAGRGRGLDVAGDLLPDPDREAGGGGVFLLLGLVGVGVGIFLLGGRGPFVEAPGARGAQQLLTMRREQLPIFGHAMGELDGPSIVLVGEVLRWRRGNVYPVLAPLTYRKA